MNEIQNFNLSNMVVNRAGDKDYLLFAEDVKEAIRRVKKIKFLTYEQLDEVDRIFGRELI